MAVHRVWKGSVRHRQRHGQRPPPPPPASLCPSHTHNPGPAHKMRANPKPHVTTSRTSLRPQIPSPQSHCQRVHGSVRASHTGVTDPTWYSSTVVPRSVALCIQLIFGRRFSRSLSRSCCPPCRPALSTPPTIIVWPLSTARRPCTQCRSAQHSAPARTHTCLGCSPRGTGPHRGARAPAASATQRTRPQRAG